MAGIFLVRANGSPFSDAALAEARQQFALHGFAGGGEAQLPGWHLLHRPFVHGGPETFLARGDDMVAVAGTLVVDGLMGRAALEALLDHATPPGLDWSRIGGQFVALLRKGGRTFLFTDYFAAFQLFHDTERRVFSTSLLATAKSLPRLAFDPQGVYEFAFNVVPIGDDTVFADLKTLSPRQMVELTVDGVVLHSIAKPLPAAVSRESVEERLPHHVERLQSIVGAHVRQFGNRVNCPLSGGLDSRLLLASLRAAGCTPYVYVYGDPGDADVDVALAIGAAEGFAVDYVDKGRPAPSPEDFPALVESNFHDLDALPTYGNIFDEGGYGDARQARHANGALAASGGCGEIFRDFFFLADRPASPLAVAKTFFARFAPGDATGAFDPRYFLTRIGDKIAEAIDAPSRTATVPRALIEQVYPRVRCRALFGREIGVEARLGAYLMPFLDHQLVAEAMTLPMRLKHAGRFEAMLLNAIDPALARHMSAYGHDFAGPPSRRHLFDEWSSRIRPSWLRARTYAIRRRLGPIGDEHGGLLEPDYMRRVIDLEFPAMRRFFNIDAITDSGMWRRIACLEYLAAHLGSRMVG